MKYLLPIAAALLPLAAPAPAFAHEGHEHDMHAPRAPAIAVSQGWTRETAPGQTTGAGYVIIENHANTPNRLIGVTSPLAATSQIHTMAMDGPVMRMRPVTGGLVIPPHGVVELKPGGLHIMLIGLRHPLRPGASVPVVLHFAQGGPVRVTLAVQPVGAMGPMGGEHGDHGHEMGQHGMDSGHDRH